MDDFQKATTEELKARFTNLEERNDRLNELIELDQQEITALRNRLAMAEGLLNEVLDKGSIESDCTPGQWVDLLLRIVGLVGPNA